MPGERHGQRVLVCGGRDHADIGRVFDVLSMYHAERHFSVLMQGGAQGADSEAAEWAARHPEVRCLTYKANWRKYGKRAGPIRNQRMLDEGKPHLVIAFSGGVGTADMVARARSVGIEIIDG